MKGLVLIQDEGETDFSVRRYSAVRIFARYAVSSSGVFSKRGRDAFRAVARKAGVVGAKAFRRKLRGAERPAFLKSLSAHSATTQIIDFGFSESKI